METSTIDAPYHKAVGRNLDHRRLHVWILNAQSEYITRICQERQITRSQFIAEAIQHYIGTMKQAGF